MVVFHSYVSLPEGTLKDPAGSPSVEFMFSPGYQAEHPVAGAESYKSWVLRSVVPQKKLSLLVYKTYAQKKLM